MNIHDLKIAQSTYLQFIHSVRAERQGLYDIRDNFRNYYTLERLQSMTLEQYALGMEHTDEGYSFCHTMEYALTGLGETKGAPASKFGVYFGRTKSDPINKWRVTSRYGSDNDHISAFNNVRQAVCNLFISGRDKDLQAIIENTLPPIFKGKILSTFFPDDYLNVFSNVHLNFFLTQLGLDTESMRYASEIMKREELVKFKNSDPVMKYWNMDDYMVFLYRCYPGRPPKGNEDVSDTDSLYGYRDPDFPQFPSPEWVELIIQTPPPNNNVEQDDSDRHTSKSNPDYEKEARKLKKYGNRGEEIVMLMEKKRLSDAGRIDLADRIERAKFDYLGYDIKSYEVNGDTRHIEVKTTTANVGQANFFLSANEFKKSKNLENYHVYVVYDIMSINPKIWIIPNPFHPEDERIVMTPMTYRVVINTSK